MLNYGLIGYIKSIINNLTQRLLKYELIRLIKIAANVVSCLKQRLQANYSSCLTCEIWLSQFLINARSFSLDGLD